MCRVICVLYNVPTYTKFGLHRVPRTDHRRNSRTPCNIKLFQILNLTIKHIMKRANVFIKICNKLPITKLIVDLEIADPFPGQNKINLNEK